MYNALFVSNDLVLNFYLKKIKNKKEAKLHFFLSYSTIMSPKLSKNTIDPTIFELHFNIPSHNLRLTMKEKLDTI